VTASYCSNSSAARGEILLLCLSALHQKIPHELLSGPERLFVVALRNRNVFMITVWTKDSHRIVIEGVAFENRHKEERLPFYCFQLMHLAVTLPLEQV